MIAPQPLPDLPSIYNTIQKVGKKDLNANKFKMLQVAKAAKNRDELSGILVQTQVYMYFNDFELAEQSLLLAKRRYAKEIKIWHMFISLYTLWGKWRKLKETIYEVYKIADHESVESNHNLFNLLFIYPRCFYDLEALEVMMSTQQDTNVDNRIMEIRSTIDAIDHLGVDIDTVRDVIGLASEVFYQEYLGVMDIEIFTSDEVNILLFVKVHDVEELLSLNSKLIEKKLEFAAQSKKSRNSNNYISATFLPLNSETGALV